MLMCSVNGGCGVGEVKYGVFSGILNTDVAFGVCCRNDFFLD